VKINIPRMLLYLRSQLAEGSRYPQHKKVSTFESLAMKGWRMSVSSAFMLGLSNTLGRLLQIPLARQGRMTKLPPPLSAWTRYRSFPALASRPFRKRWKE